jgi:hypothetical protein
LLDVFWIYLSIFSYWLYLALSIRFVPQSRFSFKNLALQVGCFGLVQRSKLLLSFDIMNISTWVIYPSLCTLSTLVVKRW